MSFRTSKAKAKKHSETKQSIHHHGNIGFLDNEYVARYALSRLPLLRLHSPTLRPVPIEQTRLVSMQVFTAIFLFHAVESDPGVFTELIEKMGARGVEVAELWSCDVPSLLALQPIYGLIFLFKWQKEEDEKPVDTEAIDRGVFFAKQVINNACATQAIISVLMNIPKEAVGFELGDELTALRDFTAEFSPEMRGLAIGNSEVIRTCHNSFRAPQSFSFSEEPSEDTEGSEAFHFVAYVPAVEGLYELDGLKPGPIRICNCDAEHWIESAAEAINDRIARYASSEVRFNLMAIIRSRIDVYNEEIRSCEEEMEKTAKASSGETSIEGVNDGHALALRSKMKDLKSMLESEEEKRKRWHRENMLRRTDFTPFVFNLLKGLAKVGKLEELISSARREENSP